MDAMTRQLVTNPCQDACGTVDTGRLHDGAPVYRCPGCDSEWVEVAASAASADPGAEATAPPVSD